MSGFFANEDLSQNRIELARLKLKADRDFIDLTSSNPTHQGLLFPPQILKEASRDYWNGRTYQPDPRGARPAREAISAFYRGREPSWEVSPEQIFITASTSEAYSLLFSLLTRPGDNILGPEVTYPLFEYLAAIHHLELRPYQLVEENGWQIGPKSLLEQTDSRTRAVLFISPHNPTGMVQKEALPELLEIGLPLICDEVFANFTFGVSSTPPLSTLFPGLPVFLLNGISKLFALPDLKLGWIALNSPGYKEFGPRLELLNDTYLSCNSLIQWMLPTLFERGAPFVKEMTGKIQANLSFALDKFKACPLLVSRVPDGGYYLFPKVLDWKDEEALVLYLMEEGKILVHPGYFYGYEKESHIMLSALTHPARWEEGLDRLVKTLNQR